MFFLNKLDVRNRVQRKLEKKASFESSMPVFCCIVLPQESEFLAGFSDFVCIYILSLCISILILPQHLCLNHILAEMIIILTNLMNPAVFFLYFHIRKEDSIFLYYFIQTDNLTKMGGTSTY